MAKTAADLTEMAPSRVDSVMEADDIQQMTVTVDRALKMVLQEVQSERKTVLAMPSSSDRDEKLAILKNLNEKVVIGLEESSLLLTLSLYISLLEAERVKFRMQMERLTEENVWLNEERTFYKNRLKDVRDILYTIRNERDSARVAFMLRKMNPDSCGKIVEEFSRIMINSDNGADNISPEDEKHFSSRMQAMYFISLQSVKNGEYDLAKLLANKMLEKIITLEGTTAPDVASLYEILAMIHRRQGNMELALPLLKKSLEIREYCFGEESIQTAITLNNLSVCQSKMTMFQDSLKSCSRAMRIKEKIHGKKSPEVAKQLHNLALVCTYLDKFSDAREFFQRAIEIHKTCPFNEEKFLKTQNSVAMCLLRQNNLSDAESLIYGLTDRYHERLLYRKPHQEFDPSLYMIIDANINNKERALNMLDDTYKVISNRDFSLVTKNLCTLYRKQAQEKKLDILMTWLTNKSSPRLSTFQKKNSDLQSAYEKVKKNMGMSENQTNSTASVSRSRSLSEGWSLQSSQVRNACSTNASSESISMSTISVTMDSISISDQAPRVPSMEQSPRPRKRSKMGSLFGFEKVFKKKQT